jgi:BMFP domain-containing protein YqiC
MDEKKLDILVKKLDGVADDVRTNGYRLDKLENRIDQLEINHGEKFDALADLIRGVANDVKTLSRQFNDVGTMAIKDNGRLTDLEKRVDIIEAQAH